MANNYDEAIKKNRQYLTQAQIDALVAASQQYNNQNAGNRAGALASAREQYDVGYRGLQNMGLAGASGAAPTSGEVPRLEQQIRTPFEDYNNRLRDVERQRLGALGNQFAQQTQAQWAAEAERQRQAQEAAARARAAAAAVGVNTKFAAAIQGVEDAARQAQINAINAKGMKQTAQVKQYAFENGIGSLLSPVEKAQRDGLLRTARPQDVAAAAAFNIAQTSQQTAVQAANAAQERGMKLTEQYKGAADTSKANQYYVDTNQKAFTKDQAEAEYKEAQNNLTNLQQKRHGGGAVSEDEYKAAVYQRDAAKLKAEDPKLYQSFAIIQNPNADAQAREEAGNEIMKSYGYTRDERSSEQYTADKKTAAQYASYLGTIDDANASTQEKKSAENMLKSMGVTPDQAREFISKHRQARAGQGEYSYYKNAILNSLTYAGKTPSRGVNKDETDPLYRAVNKLNAEKGDDYNLMYSELAALPDDVTVGEEYVGNELRYLTEDERNAYNYIYETEGLQKANQYIREGLPLRNVRAAVKDEEYAKQLVDNSPVAANFLSIAAGTFGNVPAMIEKLVKGTYNFVAQPQTPLFIDTNDDRLANMSNLIQSATSEKILASNPGTSGKIYNFAYQTGMSMAQSAVAMTFAAAGAPWAVDVMFFSSAGNEAYKDAIERGATQEQALASGVLSGVAEALFEHASIEHFMNLDYQGKGRLIKNMLSQAGAEASEEVNTELANILTDAWVMRDKSNYNIAVQQYMSEGMDKDVAENKAFMDQLGNVAMAGLGGLASGLGFGVFGALPNAVSQVKTGKEAKAANVVDQYVRNAALLGGDAQKLAQEVNDSYGVKKTKSGSIETEKVAGREKMQTSEPSNRLVGALVQQVNKQVQDLAQSAESGAAVQTLLTGNKLTTNGAKAVMDQLGADTVKEMGYDTSSPSAFAKSFNARLQENSITPRMQESKYRQAAYGMAERRNSPIEYQEKYRAFTAEDRANAAVTAARANATNRVWANPTQGMAMATPEGNRVMPMPGNLRAVEQAEQERAGFKTRATATKGNVTYAVAGMEAREGMSNEQTYSEIQKGLVKEARQKAQLYEKLASALGVKMIIHDVMTGTNGFIDENGNVHVVLSGRQSVLRVAAHELTHYMKNNAKAEYSALRSHLIAEVGNDKFDRMVKRKASEYGIDLSTEKGKILADDEVCAELCERMLSNEEALEKFAEKDLPAAKTLKEHLLKILNAIKAAFKRAENRDFGESWSDLIRQQDTIESWITGLQKAIDNANARDKTVEGQIAKTAGVTTVDQAQMDEDMREELFLDEDASAAESRREKAKANAEKGTKVDGITDDEMSRILSRSVYGDRSNYDSDDFKSVQSMLAQLVPEAIDALNGNADLDEVYAEIKTAVGEMLDKYYLDEGDHSALRELIPDVIAVDSTAKSDLKAQDTSLFQMSSKLKKALGRKVTLVGPTNDKFKSAMKLEELWHSAQDRFGLSDYQDFSVDTQKLLDFVQSQTAVRDFDSLHKSERDNIVNYQANEFVSAVDEMLAERVDKVIAEHSVDVIEYDMAGYRADLEQKGLMSKGELDDLFTTMKKAVKYVKEHRAILDFGEELNTEEDIVAAKQNRAYLPYKQNADPHYKLALDFSTLCKKRILLQMIQERLQGKLKRSLSALETIAIRREILKLQKNGVDVEVACALCYVEAARMKSHKVIDEFLGVGMTKAERAANVEAEMRNYFAQKDKDIKKVIDKDLAKWKEDKLGKDWTGFTKSGKKVGAANASKDHLKAFGGQKLVDEYNAFAKGTRSKAKVNDAQEEIIKEAKRLVQETPEAFLSAESLAKMKKSNPDIFYAFVNKVRSATRSKALETDTFYSRGDIDMVDEAIIRAANQESGFRHQSWSDFMPIHLLDTMASVIEMSQRDAKMHAYTKVPAMVELLGKTGMMLNMSMIPKGATGLKDDGTLDFDSVEGMDWDTMMRLRDAFPDTAGNIAIGISDEQIRKLLDSPDIDYVIPYHASGMNQTLRTHMNIEHWVEYTKTQNEVEKEGWKEKHKKGKMKPPALAKWFSDEEAKKAGKNGVKYMQQASEKYLDICNKEGWIPKFPQYLTKDADGNYHLNDEYKNYWKMLTDRKMVNQNTGEVIIQQAVKPKFNEQTVMDILKGEAENPTSIRNAAAADEIAGELAKTWRADRENANLKSYKAELNAFREASAVMAADRVKEDVKRRLAETRYSIDTDAIRQAFTVIDTAGIEDGLEALKDVKHVGSFALKDISRFLDASAGNNKDLRNTLHAIFEAPHSEATGRYAQGVERMQQKVLDIGKRAGVCDAKGKHFDSKKSAAIQNIGEGFSNTYTDLKLKVKDADHVTVRAYEPGTDNLVDSEKDYTLKELRQAYGTNAADYVWIRVFDETQKAQETGGKPGWVDEKVNTRPYTIDDLQTAYPNDWQKLKAAADEFRQMYDEYIRDQNNMLATIYPIESEYADVEKLEAGIEKKQERLAQHKAAVDTQIENLQKSLEAKEKEIASKKRTDTNAYRQLVEQANKLTSRIAEVKAEIAEYEANAKDEIMKMNVLKAEMQNAVQKGDYSLKRMHRLQYRSDYFHHFTEMASGIQNLKSIFTNNTDIAPAIVGKSEGTRAKTKWAGYFQQRMGGDYTADALNGMLRYGQLAEYKLAFDPLTAYLRDVNKQIRNLSSDTNRDGLIRYIDQWADTIAGKSHKLDRVVSDSGMAPRKAMQVLQWINSRVIQNTLLWNMRSALVQISNITNAKGIVKNNIDWVNGLKAWALAAKGDEAMASIMSQSNFLASRYMDGLALTDSKLKSAKQFAGWMLGALDEISAKATWWAAYQQYTRNPNAAKNQYRNYESAVDYADDITRRTHAGRGVGELAPAMTSRVVNFVAPFQVEVNNTWQLLKDNVKQKNYLGLLSTGLSVFLFNTFFEAIVGSTPLGFDFIRAVVDIALGFLNDDPDDDPDAKEIGQRFAGELVGGLPFASQLVAAFGEDNAKKLLGENNDATRYGNTQIGVSAVVNAAKGLKDIGTGLIEGRRVNWLDDLDDLMNLTLPMGAKQLTRTAQGLATVANGYAGKYDKDGNEKVQFVTDQDVLHYIHAGLFGKWALTEASEYFGEKRLLPQLFGKYNGPKSSIGNMVDAKEYKAALQTGIDGKQYFTLKYDLKKYTTQAGKRAEMMEQPFTNEQKAQLDALLIADSKKGSKAEGSVVYQKDNDGNWTVKADYSSSDWMDVAELGDTKYNQAKESGIKPETFASICTAWKGMSGKDKKDQAREYLNGLHLTKDQYDYIWTNVFKYKAE